ncbi:His Kinase A domain containing protein [Mortierella claussenii]|nr:His Kinase A domain containing protein [Mortierella claussenii]
MDLRISMTDQGDDPGSRGPSLGLTSVSIMGKSYLRGDKSTVETSVDQLKVGESRTRRISDSGLNSLSPKLSGTGLAERLSGFAQTVRGFSRTSFSQSPSSPTMTSNSTCSTPTSPAFSPQRSVDLGRDGGDDLACHSYSGHGIKQYESWDDFLYYYCQGHFPSDFPLPRPKADTQFPPTPAYVDPPDEYLPYLASPLPPNEERRLRALHSFQILHTEADPNFERVVQLVAGVMGAAGCIISLVDQLRVSTKAMYPVGFAEVPRQYSVCGHTILRNTNDPMVILDTHADWRFQNFPTICTEPFVRFYAGAPLTTLDGFNIGTICLIDFEPRASFSDKDRKLLVDFAAVVMREMELWNDQVQLCIRNRMMRDVTRWVRGCLNVARPDTEAGDDSVQQCDYRRPRPLNAAPISLLTPSDISDPSSRTPTSASVVDMNNGPRFGPTLIEPTFPTPTGSPTLLSCAFSAPSGSAPSTTAYSPSTASGSLLQDKAFPAACIMIQATMNVDAVYLVQASSNQSVIPSSESSVVWNCLDASERRKGSVGVVKGGGHVMSDTQSTVFDCLASSQKNAKIYTRPVFDEKSQHTTRQGSAWICTDEGCRPHRLGDALMNATEPVWERDQPIIKEMLGYVRQEITPPQPVPGKERLFTYSQEQETMENDWFGGSANPPSLKDRSRCGMLCHTFQGTLQTLTAGHTTPYQSALIAPILGPSSANGITTDEEPWAYFVILSSSRTKQFCFHERIYLKNFGSCLVTEVMKRRVEAADKAKGIFIKSISHELRTPVHIILGILELLYANPDEPLSDTQSSMISSAEISGKNLIDTINNIIDLARLDPNNDMEARDIRGERSIPSQEADETIMQEMDIRELCQIVAESMAKTCSDKNVVVIPSWSKASLSSLSSSASNSASGSTTNVSVSYGDAVPFNKMTLASSEGFMNSYNSSADSLHSFSAWKLGSGRKTALELLVAMDEPERDPDQDTLWKFLLDVKAMTRILTQLVENAIKFTTTGFVEISAAPLTSGPISMHPPYPEACAILFTVRDTGKGISAEFVQSHLFKRFSQEDPLQVGTGLGLALVKELVRKLGGWMEVWSEGVEGKGCVVKVLIWATPAVQQAKSLKDLSGPWQDVSCRFYAGETSVGSDRLFKIMGERMMGQQLNMNVERGDEQDISPEDMLKDLCDQSHCELLVINDDPVRLKTYLSHWIDYHREVMTQDNQNPVRPAPLLMLTAQPNLKNIQSLVDEYLKTQIDSAATERPANIMIMTKPIGPIKLVQCLRECFTPAFSNPHLQTPQGSPRLSNAPDSMRAPHITTTALGVHGTRLISAGVIIKQSFTVPTMASTDGYQQSPLMMVPSHSPGGFVLPPRMLSVGPSPMTTPEHETYPPHAVTTPTNYLHPGHKEELKLAEFKANIGTTVPKLKPRKSVRNYQTQKKLQKANVEASVADSTTNASGPDLSAAAGTTFKSAHLTERSSKSTQKSDKPALRVLIVEDNITNRMILRTFLKTRGISVVEAENGKLGVERFQEEVRRQKGHSGFDFVLMDLQMPVMDGNMATKQIREFEQSIIRQQELLNAAMGSTVGMSSFSTTANGQNNGDSDGEASVKVQEPERGYRSTIIFALTGLAADEDKRLAFECGVDGYMTKPVSLKMLGSLLSSCTPPTTAAVGSLTSPVLTSSVLISPVEPMAKNSYVL